jgi:hypothetical protein
MELIFALFSGGRRREGESGRVSPSKRGGGNSDEFGIATKEVVFLSQVLGKVCNARDRPPC